MFWQHNNMHTYLKRKIYTTYIVLPHACERTQARHSYYALLIWQSEQEAGGEHKYCLGWLFKTRDKPLIHGVHFLWKSPGGSCISSTLSKPQSLLCLLQTVVCWMSVWRCLKTHAHTETSNCKLICLTSAIWVFLQRCHDITKQPSAQCSMLRLWWFTTIF